MEYKRPQPPFASANRYQSLPTKFLPQSLDSERLRLLADQAAAELVVVGLILLGFMAVFADQLKSWGLWLSCGALLIGVYLLRILLADKYLQCEDPAKALDVWRKLFVLISILSGIAWGVFAAVLMFYGTPEIIPLVSLLIGGLTVAAIFSLGALLSAYIGYTLGLLLPVALTLLLRDLDFASSMAWAIIAYGVFVLVTAAGFHLQLNSWLRLANENIGLVNRLYELYDEQQSGDKSWEEPAAGLQQ